MKRWWSVGTLGLMSCQASMDSSSSVDLFEEERLRQHVQILASDEFEGRAPSSVGEQKTIDYMVEEFRALGLEPGNGDSFVQPVPLVSITAQASELTVAGGETELSLESGSQMMVWTKRVVEEVFLDRTEMVFVGYGIVAPEYGWNDYEGVDVQGKTVVMLVNDPGYATQDAGLFRGNAMTYYGRWTYKFEEAARQGAAGAFLVHETGAAGYPWEVVSGSWSGPQFDLVSEDRNLSRAAVEGWLTEEAARQLFDLAEMDFSALVDEAAEVGFRARSLDVQASVQIRNQLRESVSHNILAKIPGTRFPEETIVYMAHWDHLGRDTSREGDQIYNGAVDNATGTGALVEIARAFQSQSLPPWRSVLFLAVTAEESGLLGSRHYTEFPTVPMERTVAALNMDALNVHGPSRDVQVIGFGSSALEDYLSRAAARQGRVLTGDREPEKGYFFRSDHFHFAKRGVPVLYAESGPDHREHGEEYGRACAEEYRAERYHKPSDEYDASWDLRGCLEDLALLFDVGYELSRGQKFPEWYRNSEFYRAGAVLAEARSEAPTTE